MNETEQQTSDNVIDFLEDEELLEDIVKHNVKTDKEGESNGS